MSITQQRMAAIFNEWARLYAQNPDDFGEILDADGSPVEDYGHKCAICFCQIAYDMDCKGLLPLPNPVGWIHRHPVECKNGEVCNYQIAPADSVQEDAARYRWLRNKSQVVHSRAWFGGMSVRNHYGDFLCRDDALAALDAAIDAAQTKKEGEKR